MKHLSTDIDAEGIATITLDHSTESMNLVSPEWIEEFTQAVKGLAANEGVIGVIVTSAKKTFMAGADLKVLVGKFTKAEALEFSRIPSRMHRLMETSGKPYVCAINGLALGGGFELALACNRRILVDNPKAVVGLPEVTVGLLPGSGGTQRLARLIGVKAALDMLLNGRPLTPAEALALGIVDEVVPEADLMNAARAWLRTRPEASRPWDRKGYAPKDAGGLLNSSLASYFSILPAQISAKTMHNYPAPAAITAAVFEGIQLPFDKALDVESKYFAKLLSDPVASNIIRTTFINKGKAEKLIRRPADVPKAAFRSIAVLGAGMMGAGIAHVAALAGLEVFLLDRSLEEAERGKAQSAKILAKEVERGRRSQADADAVLARIRATADHADLAPADLVVEAVFEDTSVKREITRRVQSVLRPDVIFASNTSTLPISGLAKAAQDPARFIGLHFFSPVDRMALVEVILGKETSERTLAEALDFVALLRKAPIVVNDSRGFYTSRVFQTFIHEGMAMLGEGVAPALIENSARLAGMPIGPLALLDEVTLDLPMKIIKQSEEEEGERYQRPCGYETARRMLELGRSGRKAGGAFYVYPTDAPKQLWSGLADTFPVSPEQPSSELLKKRFLYIQALEAARCLEENVLTHPADGDLGSVLGWGYPTWTGGTLSMIDMVGIRNFTAECDRLAQSYGSRFLPSQWLRERASSGLPFHGE